MTCSKAVIADQRDGTVLLVAARCRNGLPAGNRGRFSCCISHLTFAPNLFNEIKFEFLGVIESCQLNLHGAVEVSGSTIADWTRRPSTERRAKESCRHPGSGQSVAGRLGAAGGAARIAAGNFSDRVGFCAGTSLNFRAVAGLTRRCHSLSHGHLSVRYMATDKYRPHGQMDSDLFSGWRNTCGDVD